jgi:hypothetical protein
MSPDIKSDVDLEIVNEQGVFSFKKLDKGRFRSVYEVSIPDTEELGFVKREEAGERIQDLITSINLTMTGATITRHIMESEGWNIQYTEEEEERYDIDRVNSATPTQSMSQRLGEELVLEIYDMMKSLNRFKPQGRNVEESNLVKSLILFDNALQQVDRDIQEMLLYMSVEVSTLIDGRQKKGKGLDKLMSKVTQSYEPIDESHFTNWRRSLVNRQKHPDRDSGDVSKSEKIFEKLDLTFGEHFRIVEDGDPDPKRKAAILIIRDRLRQLTTDST